MHPDANFHNGSGVAAKWRETIKTNFTILFDTPIHFCIAFDDS